MSLFDTFDPHSEEILKPSSISAPQEGFPQTVVLTFSNKSIHILQDICETEPVATLRGGRPVPVYKFSWNGKDVGVFHTLIGGAGTAGLLEEALALGAKKALLYGSCGVVDASLGPGRFIIPTAA